MDKIEQARQLFLELELKTNCKNEFLIRNYEIKSRLAQNIK